MACSVPCFAVEEQDSDVSSYQRVPWNQGELSCLAAAAVGKLVEDVAYSELANPWVHRHLQLA